jgi:hypothetical protein
MAMEKRFCSRLATISLAASFLFVFHVSADADFLSDPIGLKKMSDSAERIMIQLQQLEGIANAHVRERLEQVRSILRDAINGSQEVIAKATQSMLDVEKQVNSDAANLLYNVKCVTDVTLLNTAPRSFAELISTLKKADPGIKIFGIKIVNLGTNDVQILKPDEAYGSTKKEALRKLEKDVTDSSKANDIFSTYQNLELSAKFTACSYKGQAAEQDYIQDANEFERRSIPWRTVVLSDKDYIP